MTAAQFRLGGWSPDSRHLTFWSYTPEDIAQNPVEGSAIAAYGTFHVLDARTGGECQYPKDNALGLQFNFWHGWLPDGRLVTLDAAGELVALDRPCGGNMVLLSAEEKPACLMTNPDASESCSPGDSRRGITLGSGTAYTTTVVNVSTGKAEAVIPWQFSADGLGNFPGPLWLSEAQFIIHRTDEGPLLVTLGDQVQVQPMASTLFGLTGAAHQYAIGARAAGAQTFHILLTDYGSEYTQARNWLYHSESGVVEELPYAYAYFSPDGKQLDLARSLTVNNYERYERWLRAVDPPEGGALRFVTTADQNYPGWSDDWRLVAVAGPDPTFSFSSVVTLTVRAMPRGDIRQTWTVGAYSFSPFLFSPDNHFLAAIGWVSQKPETALFVFELRP